MTMFYLEGVTQSYMAIVISNNFPATAELHILHLNQGALSEIYSVRTGVGATVASLNVSTFLVSDPQGRNITVYDISNSSSATAPPVIRPRTQAFLEHNTPGLSGIGVQKDIFYWFATHDFQGPALHAFDLTKGIDNYQPLGVLKIGSFPPSAGVGGVLVAKATMVVYSSESPGNLVVFQC